MNRLVGQVAGHTQVAPGFNVGFGAAQTGRGEDRINLFHGQVLDRVVLVHEHGQGIHGYRDSGRLVAVLLLEGSQFVVFHFAAHRAQVSGAFSNRRRRGRRTGSLNLDVYVRVFFFVRLSPQGHQVRQGVGTNAGQVARHTSGLHVGLNSRVNTSGNRIGSCNACGDKSQGRHHTLQFHALLLANGVR